jgi:hypothetical protein
MIKIKKNLEKHYDNANKESARGAQIRARVKYVEQDERNTKYFLSLETKHQTNNKIYMIAGSDGVKQTDQVNILNEARKYYEELYKSKHISETEIDNYLEKLTPYKKALRAFEASLCEGLITKTECKSIITLMKKNKSPSLDGLPIEFYLTFWPHLHGILVDSFNEAFADGKLSDLQKNISVDTVI